MLHRSSIVTLTSDFGSRGSYVGAMRGAVLSRNPAARLIDITHQVGPQNVAEGARALAEACPCFPPGTVHLAVVDPGVGTARAGLAIESGGHILVGPDNGLLIEAAALLGDFRAHRIDNAAYRARKVSATFHGRDIFAPVAGALSAGEPVESVGPFVSSVVGPPALPRPRETEYGLIGQVVFVDGFGNLITNMSEQEVAADAHVSIAGHTLPGLVRTYGEAAGASLVALIGSSGMLEVAVPGGSAAAVLGVGPGEPVEVAAP